MHPDDCFGPAGLVGRHKSMLEIYRLIAQLGPTTAPTLIVGETGTGKELVARALHMRSHRNKKPFEVINCAAIPHELAESELFGHARGAFTGATRGYCGAFERADGGTLFLDEIGEMPISLQPKLLRALEQEEIRRVGSEHSRRVNVRIIAATHRRLEREIDSERFRLDLYHRLAVGIIKLPSLRERAEDIGLLAHTFIAGVNRRQQRRCYLSAGALVFLKTLPWPGNVRALKNAIERAATTAENDCLTPKDFSFLHDCCASEPARGLVRYEGRPFSDIRREIYERTIADVGGNRSAAAATLRIPKSTFFDHLRELKITM